MKANLQLAGVQIGTTQVDVLLPSQYFATRRKQQPAERLMIAVLHDALDCVEKYRFATDSRGQQTYHEARHWFLVDEANWPYSFECICAVLDLEPNAVRQRIRIGTKQARSRRISATGPRQVGSLQQLKSGTYGG